MNLKKVVITGGAGGIGQGLVEKFLSENFEVLIVDNCSQKLSDFKKKLSQKYSKNFYPIECDISCEDGWRKVSDFVEKNFEGRLDAIVNNAGIGITKSVEELSFDEWSSVINTNLSSVFLSAKYCAKFLRNAGGCVVNIASTRALQSEANTEAYSASKGGIVAITHALAMSLAPLRVNCVSPGWIDNGSFPNFTEADLKQHPVERVGEPRDIANLVFFLTDSSQSSFITGQNFYCDGGMTKKMIYV